MLDQVDYSTILCRHIEGDILCVTLNRPEAANALNTQMALDLRMVFDALHVDADGIRCVILTGSGERFCAGGDLKERDGMSDEAWRAQHVIFERAFESIIVCPVPVIAAVNGAAYGGGCEFALACDFIFAAEHARFAQTETRLGIIPGGGGTQTLSRAVGTRRAKELIFSAEPFTAVQAHGWGMVNRLVPAERLMEEAIAAAGTIARNGPIAVRQAKLAINHGAGVDLRSAMAAEISAYNLTVSSEDRREGITAANQRRAPNFTGK